ncbi:MAG: Ig-like domain repeat protein, partial [Firmicutes bacterium]|nr:Ig-like domain repeat protein [Bacillota bacterium]
MKKSMLILICVLLCMFAFTAGISADNSGYDLVTGDTDSQGRQRVRVTNININGVDVTKHVKTGDYVAVVFLPANTDKNAELTFTLDCVLDGDPVQAGIFMENKKVGTVVADESDNTKGTWTYSVKPEWSENGEATYSFSSRYAGYAGYAKTYTVNLRILGENKAPTLKDGVDNEVEAMIAVGESYTISFDDLGCYQDYELDDLTYTVSINGGEAVPISSVFYSYGPHEAGEYTLVFNAKDSAGNVSDKPYTVKITAMDLTKVEIGGTMVDAWNADINRIDLGLCDVKEVVKSETEANTWNVILDENTSTDDALYFRVKASARAGRLFGILINDKGVDGAVTDGTNMIWTAKYTPEWNENGEASLAFMGDPHNNNRYIYTLKLKIDNPENKAPVYAEGETGSKTDSVEQYFDYTVDVASLFSDEDDSWLTYSVSVDGGEEQVCGESFSIAPNTTDTKTLKFYATDFLGAKSEAYTVTLKVDPYKIDKGWFPINNMTPDGGLLSMTVKDAEGNIIEGVKFKMTSSIDSDNYKTLTHTIDVALPGDTVAANDQITSFWHMVYGENGLPALTTSSFGTAGNIVNDTKDGVKTTLSGGLGSTKLYFYEKVTDSADENLENRVQYVVNYHIVRDNNQAPVFADGVDSTETVTMDQYETYSVNLNDIFSDPEGDKVTYSVSVDGAEATPLVDDRNRPTSSYSMELTTDEDHKIFFYATDALGDVSNAYVVKLKVNTVLRYAIETGEGAGTFTSGLNKFMIYGVVGEKHVLVKDGYNRYITIQLAESTPDNAELDIQWEGNNDSVSMGVANPVKLVDGKADFMIESNGHFFDKNHRYYYFSITNTPNTLPTLAEGVEAEVSANIVVGTAYEADLSSIFADADGDELSYTVSVNGGEEVAADAAYSYDPGKIGDYKLVFCAKDSWGASEETYTVNLAVTNSETTFDAEVKVPENITPVFSVNGGFDENGKDMPTDTLTAEKGSTVKGWTTYTVKVPDNLTSVSVRGTDAEGNDWGGMSFDVSADMETVTLRPVPAVINPLV